MAGADASELSELLSQIRGLKQHMLTPETQIQAGHEAASAIHDGGRNGGGTSDRQGDLDHLSLLREDDDLDESARNNDELVALEYLSNPDAAPTTPSVHSATPSRASSIAGDLLSPTSQRPSMIPPATAAAAGSRTAPGTAAARSTARLTAGTASSLTKTRQPVTPAHTTTQSKALPAGRSTSTTGGPAAAAAMAARPSSRPATLSAGGTASSQPAATARTPAKPSGVKSGLATAPAASPIGGTPISLRATFGSPASATSAGGASGIPRTTPTVASGSSSSTLKRPPATTTPVTAARPAAAAAGTASAGKTLGGTRLLGATTGSAIPSVTPTGAVQRASGGVPSSRTPLSASAGRTAASPVPPSSTSRLPTTRTPSATGAVKTPVSAATASKSGKPGAPSAGRLHSSTTAPPVSPPLTSRAPTASPGAKDSAPPSSSASAAEQSPPAALHQYVQSLAASGKQGSTSPSASPMSAAAASLVSDHKMEDEGLLEGHSAGLDSLIAEDRGLADFLSASTDESVLNSRTPVKAPSMSGRTSDGGTADSANRSVRPAGTPPLPPGALVAAAASGTAGGTVGSEDARRGVAERRGSQDLLPGHMDAAGDIHGDEDDEDFLKDSPGVSRRSTSSHHPNVEVVPQEVAVAAGTTDIVIPATVAPDHAIAPTDIGPQGVAPQNIAPEDAGADVPASQAFPSSSSSDPAAVDAPVSPTGSAGAATPILTQIASAAATAAAAAGGLMDAVYGSSVGAAVPPSASPVDADVGIAQPQQPAAVHAASDVDAHTTAAAEPLLEPPVKASPVPPAQVSAESPVSPAQPVSAESPGVEERGVPVAGAAVIMGATAAESAASALVPEDAPIVPPSLTPDADVATTAATAAADSAAAATAAEVIDDAGAGALSPGGRSLLPAFVTDAASGALGAVSAAVTTVAANFKGVVDTIMGGDGAGPTSSPVDADVAAPHSAADAAAVASASPARPGVAPAGAAFDADVAAPSPASVDVAPVSSAAAADREWVLVSPTISEPAAATEANDVDADAYNGVGRGSLAGDAAMVSPRPTDASAASGDADRVPTAPAQVVDFIGAPSVAANDAVVASAIAADLSGDLARRDGQAAATAAAAAVEVANADGVDPAAVDVGSLGLTDETFDTPSHADVALVVPGDDKVAVVDVTTGDVFLVAPGPEDVMQSSIVAADGMAETASATAATGAKNDAAAAADAGVADHDSAGVAPVATLAAAAAAAAAAATSMAADVSRYLSDTLMPGGAADVAPADVAVDAATGSPAADVAADHGEVPRFPPAATAAASSNSPTAFGTKPLTVADGGALAPPLIDLLDGNAAAAAAAPASPSDKAPASPAAGASLGVDVMDASPSELAALASPTSASLAPASPAAAASPVADVMDASQSELAAPASPNSAGVGPVSGVAAATAVFDIMDASASELSALASPTATVAPPVNTAAAAETTLIDVTDDVGDSVEGTQLQNTAAPSLGGPAAAAGAAATAPFIDYGASSHAHPPASSTMVPAATPAVQKVFAETAHAHPAESALDRLAAGMALDTPAHAEAAGHSSDGAGDPTGMTAASITPAAVEALSPAAFATEIVTDAFIAHTAGGIPAIPHSAEVDSRSAAQRDAEVVSATNVVDADVAWGAESTAEPALGSFAAKMALATPASPSTADVAPASPTAVDAAWADRAASLVLGSFSTKMALASPTASADMAALLSPSASLSAASGRRATAPDVGSATAHMALVSPSGSADLGMLHPSAGDQDSFSHTAADMAGGSSTTGTEYYSLASDLTTASGTGATGFYSLASETAGGSFLGARFGSLASDMAGTRAVVAADADAVAAAHSSSSAASPAAGHDPAVADVAADVTDNDGASHAAGAPLVDSAASDVASAATGSVVSTGGLGASVVPVGAALDVPPAGPAPADVAQARLPAVDDGTPTIAATEAAAAAPPYDSFEPARAVISSVDATAPPAQLPDMVDSRHTAEDVAMAAATSDSAVATPDGAFVDEAPPSSSWKVGESGKPAADAAAGGSPTAAASAGFVHAYAALRSSSSDSSVQSAADAGEQHLAAARGGEAATLPIDASAGFGVPPADLKSAPVPDQPDQPLLLEVDAASPAAPSAAVMSPAGAAAVAKSRSWSLVRGETSGSETFGIDHAIADSMTGDADGGRPTTPTTLPPVAELVEGHSASPEAPLAGRPATSLDAEEASGAGAVPFDLQVDASAAAVQPVDVRADADMNVINAEQDVRPVEVTSHNTAADAAGPGSATADDAASGASGDAATAYRTASDSYGRTTSATLLLDSAAEGSAPVTSVPVSVVDRAARPATSISTPAAADGVAAVAAAAIPIADMAAPDRPSSLIAGVMGLASDVVQLDTDADVAGGMSRPTGSIDGPATDVSGPTAAAAVPVEADEPRPAGTSYGPAADISEPAAAAPDVVGGTPPAGSVGAAAGDALEPAARPAAPSGTDERTVADEAENDAASDDEERQAVVRKAAASSSSSSVADALAADDILVDMSGDNNVITRVVDIGAPQPSLSAAAATTDATKALAVQAEVDEVMAFDEVQEALPKRCGAASDDDSDDDFVPVSKKVVCPAVPSARRRDAGSSGGGIMSSLGGAAAGGTNATGASLPSAANRRPRPNGMSVGGISGTSDSGGSWLTGGEVKRTSGGTAAAMAGAAQLAGETQPVAAPVAVAALVSAPAPASAGGTGGGVVLPVVPTAATSLAPEPLKAAAAVPRDEAEVRAAQPATGVGSSKAPQAPSLAPKAPQELAGDAGLAPLRPAAASSPPGTTASPTGTTLSPTGAALSPTSAAVSTPVPKPMVSSAAPVAADGPDKTPPVRKKSGCFAMCFRGGD